MVSTDDQEHDLENFLKLSQNLASTIVRNIIQHSIYTLKLDTYY